MSIKIDDIRSQFIRNPAYALEAAKGDFIMDVTEFILCLLEKEGITRQELANRLGKTKGYVSQLLNGSRNMTLGTLAEIALALNHKPTIEFEKRSDLSFSIDPVEIDTEDEVIYHTTTKVIVA